MRSSRPQSYSKFGNNTFNDFQFNFSKTSTGFYKPNINRTNNFPRNFRIFSSTEEDEKDTIRTIYKIDIIENDGILKICFKGSGFLKYMVRTIVGSLIEVGKENVTKNDIINSLNTQTKLKHYKKAPACGLYLDSVEY